MDHAIFDLDGRTRVSKQNAPVRLGRWDVDVAEVGQTLLIERDPELGALHSEVLEIDVPLKIEGVEIFNLDRCEKLVDLSDPLAGRRIVEFDTIHLHGSRRKPSVKLVNLGANPVACKRVLYLAGDITVYKAE